ncbi:MAG: 2-oxo-4-hydroxy-4-carboxy-5-ureidoimidazoline decarboxylase [Candidatus Sericytochromatia bacterium]|nr:2-oxo-4-hydroxy-4-carboxy-5-ureidoimidazoline decarboxylase [Candidatus Sericytochromatia bacterium]
MDEFNAAPRQAAIEALQRCCGATTWVQAMVQARPFADLPALLAQADSSWARCGESDWLEAFSHHPRIGDVASLRTKFADTANWAESEQGGTRCADQVTLEALAAGNHDYEARFGHIFIVCATGKTAGEMLELLRTRLDNPLEIERPLAATEQHRITRLRLEKLFT